MEKEFKAAIFDLDGVIVDTARLHYLAWKKIALKLGVELTVQHNESLKGISRMAAMDYLIDRSGKTVTESERQALAEEKNNDYCTLIETLTENDSLPGAVEYLKWLRQQGVLIALGSASKNAVAVLEKLQISQLFDAIVDGTQVSKAKPDPEVFLLGAHALGVSPAQCVVFEDAAAGIQAAKSGGMYAVGVGTPQKLPEADLCVPGLGDPAVRMLFCDV